MDIRKIAMNKNISFLRIRPCDNDNEIYLNSRKKEGTSAFSLKEDLNLDINKIHKKGFQTLSKDIKDNSDVWIVTDDNWKDYEEKHQKRLIYLYKNNKESALEIIDRLSPRTILVSKTADLEFINSINTKVKFMTSIYVDTVEDAIKFIDFGVSDLLLRDWSSDQIQELQRFDGVNLYERTLMSPIFSIDEARDEFDKERYFRYLNTRNVRGFRREKTDWSPGSGKSIPKLNGFTFNNKSQFNQIDIDVILKNVLDGYQITDKELKLLFKTAGEKINDIANVANELNFIKNGNNVSYVINRNINYTNQCYYKCGFCGFSKGPNSLNLKEKPYSIDIEEVVARSTEAFEMGASEVCLQGGIHPEYTGEFYLKMVKDIKASVPDMHIHGFTPLEIWQGAETINMDIEEYLKLLKTAGLNTLPGTAAEILDDRIRKYLCPDKITSAQWAYVMEVAHSLGIKSTATIMFGHIDDIESWGNHFSLIRNIQNKTKGFTEVVPLPFVHMGSPIYLQGKSMPGPTWDEVVLIHSLARIYFSNTIDNIQASWVKLGHDGAGKLLHAGVNDLGGTLINENISRASGADHGQETTQDEFINLIESNNKNPVLRNTLYTEFKDTKSTLKNR
ncbi:MAG: 7,8-didemethyl-8-hydroxy-5-deazariboflavin synthase subunit CofH [Actinobacteria bacterium]|nr:7,8-didemethyl-8-hydroxy-5-deazariboflavin synthase subunit CofH [Actinomycetota bacterium]